MAGVGNESGGSRTVLFAFTPNLGLLNSGHVSAPHILLELAGLN